MKWIEIFYFMSNSGALGAKTGIRMQRKEDGKGQKWTKAVGGGRW